MYILKKYLYQQGFYLLKRLRCLILASLLFCMSSFYKQSGNDTVEDTMWFYIIPPYDIKKQFL